MWTTEQIIALAPDPSSEKSGRALANAAKWQSFGRAEKAVWGECHGSGKSPYQTAIDLREPAFKCSCPSRKFPCKHALGLFLLFAAQEKSFQPQDPPAFCADWLARRDSQKERQAKTVSDLTPQEKEKRERSKAKRGAEREKKVFDGLRELEIWLKDLIRRGLVVAKSQPPVYWEKTAKRMVDAQAPGIARLIRELSSAISQTDDWAEDFLEKAGKMFLLIEAFRNLEKLPAATRADVKTAIGWTVKEDELQAAETVTDKWFVVGQKVYEEEKLRVQRTWLSGEESRRAAMILDFTFQNQPLGTSFAAGTKIEAELAFYPGNFPLRAVVRNHQKALEHFTALRGLTDFDALLDGFAGAVSRNVWLEVFPAALEAVVPVRVDEKCFLRDRNARLLPIVENFDDSWDLIAFSGGGEIGVFGEWDGAALFPLRAFDGGRMIIL